MVLTGVATGAVVAVGLLNFSFIEAIKCSALLGAVAAESVSNAFSISSTSVLTSGYFLSTRLTSRLSCSESAP